MSVKSFEEIMAKVQSNLSNLSEEDLNIRMADASDGAFYHLLLECNLSHAGEELIWKSVITTGILTTVESSISLTHVDNREGAWYSSEHINVESSTQIRWDFAIFGNQQEEKQWAKAA